MSKQFSHFSREIKVKNELQYFDDFFVTFSLEFLKASKAQNHESGSRLSGIFARTGIDDRAFGTRLNYHQVLFEEKARKTDVGCPERNHVGCLVQSYSFTEPF